MITPSTGPWRSASAGDINTPISTANASVHNTKKLPNIFPGEAASPAAAAERASGNDVHPVSNSHQHSYECAPAKPPQRTWHQLGNNNSSRFGIELLQKWHVHEGEEVQQPHPGYSGNKMYPAKNHEDGGFAARKVDLRCGPQADKRNQHLASKVCHSTAFLMRRFRFGSGGRILHHTA